MQEFKLNGESMDIVEDNIEKLKSIFPDIFTEEKVDFDKLQEILGNYIEKKEERYNFTWNGKSAALRLAQTPSTGTLRPCKEESKDWDSTENLYIEGDNLEVLKLLQKSYHNKIKMIYIDPPYNTGNDFVYKDDFKDNIEYYKKITGQINAEGNSISSNSESDGRYHTNWLNMMYPRLRLARNLLSDNGVVFISIDDVEVQNLRKICDEIFGNENFICQFVWKSRQNKDNRNISGVSIDHEYILAYSKLNNQRLFIGAERDTSQYSNPDNDPRGDWTSANMAGILDATQRPNCHYDLIDPKTNINYGRPTMGWRYDQNTMNQLINDNLIIWPASPEGRPRRKVFLKDMTLLPGYSSITGIDIYTRNGSKEIVDLFESKYFNFPKPTALIKDFIQQTTSDDDIILDFFSGSATTAHATMQLNADTNMCRKFILVQMPELTEGKSEAHRAGYKNICEIGKERIRRAGEKIKDEIESNNKQLKLGEEPKKLPDIGFKVFKLDTSNIKKWNGNADTIEEEIQGSIFNYEVGRSELDVVYEIMLKCGLDLTYPIEEINVNGKILYSIGAGAMFVCMDNDITQDIADKIVEIKDEHDIVEPVTVFKDNGFTTDSNKTNIKETLRVAGIKDFITV